MKNKITCLLGSLIFVFSSLNLFAQAPVITQEPSPRGVIEGQTATFSVKVIGSSLTLQWYVNNIPIGSSNDSIYTTPPTTLLSNGAGFKVIVSNTNGSDTSIVVKLYVTASGSRVTANQIVLYNFKEKSGNQVKDVSGFVNPLDLNINNTSSVDWSNNGLYVKSGALINSSNVFAAGRVIDDIRHSDEMTLEMWVRPLTTGNARIIELSKSDGNINFKAENFNGYNFSVRTTTTDNQGNPGVADGLPLTEDFIHLVFTRSAEGDSKIYRNGVEVASSPIGGQLWQWVYQAQLSLGSYLDGTTPYEGIFYLTSIFDRALDSVEVAHNFSLGYSGTKAPFIIEQPENSQLLEGYSATFIISAVGNTPLSYQWQKNGLNISGATDSFYTTSPVTLADSGSVFRVIATNAFGSDTSDVAILEVWQVNPDCPAGIISYYHLDESSSPYNNSVGFAVGTSSTPPASVPGIVGTAQEFSNPQKIDIPDDITFDWAFNQSFSMEFWMKTTSIPSGNVVIVGRDDAVNSMQWWVGLNSNGNVTFSLRNTTGEGIGIGNINPAENDGNWHLITAVRDESVNRNYLYIDGNKIDTAVINYSSGFESGAQVNIGHLTSGFYYSGSLDELATYNTALSQTEIQSHYNKGLAGLGYCDIPFIVEPKNLIAQAKFKKVELAWQDSSNNEDGFIIESKYGVLDFAVIDSVLANVTSFTDSNVVDTTNYTYRVKAYNLLGQSGYSNTASVTTLLSTVAAPGNLLAFLSPADTHNVKLTWVDNSPNELGFAIERKTGDSLSAGTFVNIGLAAANATFYEDSTVADTTTYTYRVRAFNEFALSDYSNQAEVTTSVPVELTSFTANVIAGQVQLDWETATEINNAGFSIQRSKENNKFIDLAFIKGKGTTTTQSSYSFSDKSVLSGKYYYRLKQVDFDGSANYLKSVEVDLGLPKDYALEQNYPNPFNPSTTIRFALPINAQVNIKLYNALGQEVANIFNGELNAGIHETVFNASNLSSGVYFYMLKVQGANGSNFTSTKRMILMK